ncbi:MAG: SpoIIE family protein phosphatase [Thiotrichales bacterium]|nr:SpoIIE family protein phosphatase [Thiotrichales bacterium]
MSKENKPDRDLDNLEHQHNQLKDELRTARAKIEQYQQIFDLLPEYIFGIDENGKYLLANKRLADELNVPHGEMEGKMDYEVISNEEELNTHRDIREKVLSTGKPIYIPEFLATNRHGEKIPVEIRRIPYIDTVTGMRAVLGTASDITERKRIEQELFDKRCMENDIQIARTIQQGLLPGTNPSIPCFEIAGWNQPADDTGGDYYDWLELPGNQFAFTIADASGHGIGPALMAAVCRAYMRASHAMGEDLENMMTKVNNLLADDLKDGRFITAVVAILDTNEKLLNVYSAGHAPLFFYNAKNDEVEIWDADDIPLGIETRHQSVSPRKIQFDIGDMFVLLTDGFFSLGSFASDSECIGHISSLIHQHNEESSQELINILYRELSRDSNSAQQSDDLTAVVLKCQSDSLSS